MTYRPPDGFIVSVAFGRSEEKLYDYWVPGAFDDDVLAGDRVVVDSPFQGYVCARVVLIKQETEVAFERLNRIVDLVNDGAYKLWAAEKTRKQFADSANEQQEQFHHDRDDGVVS